MPNVTIISIVPAAQANSVIDNLTEAEFSESDISLVMQDDTAVRRIINRGGPLADATDENLEAKLAELGVPDARQIANRLSPETAVIALSTTNQSAEAAKEILGGAGAELVEVV